MTPHLSYARNDNDEFLHPGEGWLLLDRAVSFDSWITWRQALPDAPTARQQLTGDVAQAITALAYEIHRIHQRLPGYMRLGESPFVFSRWWDPYAEDEWRGGGICLFRIDGFRAAVIEDRRPEGGHIRTRIISEHYIEAALVSDPATVLSQDRGPSGRRLKKTASRRTPRTRPD